MPVQLQIRLWNFHHKAALRFRVIAQKALSCTSMQRPVICSLIRGRRWVIVACRLSAERLMLYQTRSLFAASIVLSGLGLLGCSNGNNGGPTDRDSAAQSGSRDDQQLQSGTAAGASRTDNGISGSHQAWEPVAAQADTRTTALYLQMPEWVAVQTAGRQLARGPLSTMVKPTLPNPQTPANSPNRP